MDATLERHLTAFRARREKEQREHREERERALLRAKHQLAFGGTGELFKALRAEMRESALRNTCPDCGAKPGQECKPEFGCDQVERVLNTV